MTQNSDRRNIKLAYMFTTSNSHAAFERLRFASCITVCINPNSRVLEAAKRKIHASPTGIKVGAVGYPYKLANGEIDKAQGLHEVSAVKTASLTFKCCINDDGKMSPLEYDVKNRMYKDLFGNYIPAQSVVHKHFNSILLNQQRELVRQGKPLTVHQDYYRWLEKMSTKKRVIDVANKVGEEMTDVTQEVYFGAMTPSNQINWPDFYLRTHQVVNIKDNAVDDYIYRAARFVEGSFGVEFAPHQGVVTRVEKNEEEGLLYIDLTRVANEPSDGQRLYRLTDKITTIDIPFCKYTEMLVDVISDKVAGDTVTQDQVVSKTTRILSLIGFHPDLDSLEDLTGGMSELFRKKLTRYVIEANRTMINNVPAISFNFLKDLPPGIDWKNDVYMRNVKTRGLYVGTIADLRGQLNDYVEFDLIHHSFFDYLPRLNAPKSEADVVLDTNRDFGDHLNLTAQNAEG